MIRLLPANVSRFDWISGQRIWSNELGIGDISQI